MAMSRFSLMASCCMCSYTRRWYSGSSGSSGICDAKKFCSSGAQDGNKPYTRHKSLCA